MKVWHVPPVITVMDRNVQHPDFLPVNCTVSAPKLADKIFEFTYRVNLSLLDCQVTKAQHCSIKINSDQNEIGLLYIFNYL